jgi:hypothetical protein
MKYAALAFLLAIGIVTAASADPRNMTLCEKYEVVQREVASATSALDILASIALLEMVVDDTAKLEADFAQDPAAVKKRFKARLEYYFGTYCSK